MAARTALGRLFGRVRQSDLLWSFRSSKTTMVAGVVVGVMFLASFLAPWIAPQDPYDPASLSLSDAMKPPVFSDRGFWLCPGGYELREGACAEEAKGSWQFPLGTDDQGRDLLSTILYGTRLSLVVGFASIALAMVLGIGLGLLSGYAGGALDALLMRVADVQLTIPAILIALTLDGIVRGIVSTQRHEEIALFVIVFSIGLSLWVQFARTVRGSVMVERTKDYVAAARIIGVSSGGIMLRHILPNTLGPVFVISTINLAVAIITEATLSFLGVGLPPTQPSLGTLIRVGNDYLFSGEWWITVMPGIALAVLILGVNLLGDWLRDALNPKLR
jgi:peptide/nickel transport system permease protein